MLPRLKAGIWVAAHIRRCEAAGLFVYVLRSGDDSAGSVLLKIVHADRSATVLSPTTQMDGSRAWMRAGGVDRMPEPEADAYITRQINYDPDLWVLEIEDRDGRHALDEPIV